MAAINVPRYTIDLSDIPEKRWDHIIDEYENSDIFCKTSTFISQSLVDEFGWFLGKYMIPLLFCFVSCFAWYFGDKEYIDELKGIAKRTTKYGLTFNKLYQLNIDYDFLAACTSSIVSDKGKRWHMRNMDWKGDVLRNTTIQVDFVRNDVKIFTATTWVGFVGILTGMRYGDNPMSISLNFRKKGNSYIWNIFRYFRGIQPTSFLIRKTLQEENVYLYESKYIIHSFISPCYLVIAQPDYSDLLMIDRNFIGAYGSNTEIVQTNIDQDIKVVDPKWANGDELLLNSIIRRDKNRQDIYELKKINSEELFKIMKNEPVFNNQTVYTTIMCPNDGLYESVYYLQ